MIVKIQTRNDKGKYVKACGADFAEAALKHIADLPGDIRGWDWLRWCLMRFCISKARDCAGNNAIADRWYARYQAIRGIE